MKNILRTVALAAAVIATSGCSKDFLTEVPHDFLAPENFYRNAEDAIAATSGVYTTFINTPAPVSRVQYVGRNFYMLMEYPTEEMTIKSSATNERGALDCYHISINSAHTYFDLYWEAAYAGINKANAVIERVPKVTMDATRRDQLVAEAKFLRALHYYFLAGSFGGVPLKLTETNGITDPTIARATAAETWAQIEKDLTEAAAVLPAAWPTSDYGRATKGAALTLLGKAYLMAAGTGAAPSDWQKGLDALRTVMTMGYALDANYASLFDGSNEKSKEIIFSFQNIRVDGAGGTLTQFFLPTTNPLLYALGSNNTFQAERAFYDSYNPTDIRKAGTWLTTFTLGTKVLTWAWTAGIEKSSSYGSTGPSPAKYVDLKGASLAGEEPDFVVTRYADVVLSAAEAINEVSGPTAEAYGFVNQVRARAKVPNLTAGLSQAQFRDSLFLERRYELAVEMHALFDGRRNWPWFSARIAKSMSNIANDNKSPFVNSAPKFDARDGSGLLPAKFKLWPIPVRACQLNAKLTQNPGWEDGVCK